MSAIIDSIQQAELKAVEIKTAALEKANVIAGNAETRCAEIDKLCEAECKAYREKTVREAEVEAQKAYDNEITVKRAEASKYASDRLQNCDKHVNDIVRRITRGNC